MNKQEVIEKLEKLEDTLHTVDVLIKKLTEADDFVTVSSVSTLTESERERIEGDMFCIDATFNRVRGQFLDFTENMESLLYK